MSTKESDAEFPMDREAAEQEIALLVRKPGFDELTPADIVRHMNTRFNINFDSHKSELKMMVIQEIQKRNEDETSESESGLSDSDSDEDKKPKVEPEEDVEEEKKAESSSDSDDDKIEDTPTKSSRKPRSKRTGDQDMISNLKSSTSRRAAASNAMKQIRITSGAGFSKSKSKKEKDPNEDNSGRFGRMTKLCYISPELQTVTGDEYMKRCDVVKKLWDYIKEHDLKDPKAKQFILCNEVLEPIFKRKRIKGFGMAKYLTKHIIEHSHMTPDQKAESEREMEKRRAEWLERKRLLEQGEQTPSAEDGPEEKKLKVDEDSD